MKTLDLLEAAAFLKVHPETLRRRARTGDIPSAKPGKGWVFIEDDLVDWLRRDYAGRARAVEAGEMQCSTEDRTAGIGGCGSPRQTAEKYASLLERKTRKTPRNMRRR